MAYATGSRADYGIVRRFLGLVQDDGETELKILATGALLDENYGHSIDLIYKDGFDVDFEADIELNSASDRGILHSMAVALDKFAEYFDRVKYDLLIILGDRFEMLSVAEAAAVSKIPILHIHGGEATFANYDEFIRHSVTKMSTYHFTSTEEYRRRVIQLGEAPDRVFDLGALGAENCTYIDEGNVPEEIKSLPAKKYFVVLFHPETLTAASEEEQVKELLGAIKEHEDYLYVFIGSNADTNSHIIRDMIKRHVNDNSNALYYENLHSDAYHYLVKNSVCLIGNSSSGIIEAPSLGVYTINVGNRQDGRVKGGSVIDVKCDKAAVSEAIDRVIGLGEPSLCENPYYRENAAVLYYEKLKEILSGLSGHGSQAKVFYDVEFK